MRVRGADGKSRRRWASPSSATRSTRRTSSRSTRCRLEARSSKLDRSFPTTDFAPAGGAVQLPGSALAKLVIQLPASSTPDQRAAMQRFTAACAQFAITPMDAAANTAKAAAWTRRAVDETGAQLVVLPETVTTGFVPDVGPDGLWDTGRYAARSLREPLQAGCAGIGHLCGLPQLRARRRARRRLQLGRADRAIGRRAGHLSQDAPVPHRAAHCAAATPRRAAGQPPATTPSSSTRRWRPSACPSATTATSRNCSARWRSWARR